MHWEQIMQSANLAQLKSRRMRVCDRAVVWLVDLWRGSFEEAQGGVALGAVVVKAGV
jgi:hypothetical protein